MAMYMDQEGQGIYDRVASPSSQYTFAPLKHWLSKLGLSHLETALKDQDVELKDLVMLNNHDLDELCSEIKDFLKQKATFKTKIKGLVMLKNNSKLTLKQKATFKREVINEQFKYNEFMLDCQQPITNNTGDNDTSQSVIVTEEQALQSLNKVIQTYSSAYKTSQDSMNNAKQLHSSIIMSIAQISKHFELFLTEIFQVSYGKFIKGSDKVSVHLNETVTVLKSTKKSCTNEQVDVVKKIEEAIKQAGTDMDGFRREFGDTFFEQECLTAMLKAVASDINVVKMVQQCIAFAISQFRPAVILLDALCGRSVNDKKHMKTHHVFLLILPHAVDYVSDIENELKQNDIKIVKKHGNIENDKAKWLVLKQWAAFIDEDVEDDEKEFMDKLDDRLLQEFKDGNPKSNAVIWVLRHLSNYFKTATNQCIGWEIELEYTGESYCRGDNALSDNFNIWYPSILGEYSSVYLPNTMNGKFMKLWTSKQDAKELNARINLGFTDVIDARLVKEILNIEIDEANIEDNINQKSAKKARNLFMVPM